MSKTDRMPLVDTLQVLSELRGDGVVVTSMGSAREWIRMSRHPLDFHYVPSTMGGSLPLALGIALAQPNRGVIALSGDGSLLMNLGSLITVAATPRENLTVIVMDNGVYEVTGGQKLVTSSRPIDLVALARAVGFSSVGQFDDLETWKSSAATSLAQPGPRFLSLRVAPVPGDFSLAVPGPMPDRITAFRAALLG